MRRTDPKHTDRLLVEASGFSFGLIEIGENILRPGIKTLSGFCQAECAGCPLEKLCAKLVFEILDPA